MRTIVKIIIRILFPLFKIIILSIIPKFFQILRNKRSPIPSLIFIQRILTLLFTCTIEPETYGIAIRKEEKGRKKEKEREEKKKEKRNERGLIYVSASFLDPATWNACT